MSQALQTAIEELAARRLVGPGCVIDATEAVAEDGSGSPARVLALTSPR